MQDYLYCPQCASLLNSRLIDQKIRKYCPNCQFIHYANPLPAVMAIVENQQQILLVKRGVAPAKGAWTFPSGFIEAAETPEEAVLRELKEETGIVGSIRGIINAYTEHSKIYGPIINIAYAVRPLGGTLAAGDDAQAVSWSPKDQLGDLAFAIFRQAYVDYSNIY